MRRLLKAKVTKEKTTQETGGMVVGAIIILAVYYFTETVTWWSFALALVAMVITDAAIGYEEVDEPKVKTRKTYVHKDENSV